MKRLPKYVFNNRDYYVFDNRNRSPPMVLGTQGGAYGGH
eukprot:COSAG02_NODE_1026_length_15134_cov_382.979714_4_plen_39_part_00